MKRKVTTILAIILCMLIALTGVTVFKTGTAYAASGKTPFKVTFNKKAVTLSDDLNSVLKDGIDKPDIEMLKKAWGSNPTYEGGNDFGGWGSYAWEKGKSNIGYFYRGEVSGISFNINDKNGAVCGIKFGTKKATVLKKLKKMVDAENIDNSKNSITVVHVTDNRAGAVSIFFNFKKGKLANITGTAYAKSDY